MTRTRHYIEYWIISFFLLIPFSAFSKDAEVKGTLFDAALKIPVEMATVRLSHLPDSTFISGTASDKDGLFKFSAVQHFFRTGFEAINILKKSRP